jgi:transcriptional regulator with XRE-family HTH domain
MNRNRLKDRRIAEGLTITDLARLSNISTKVISQTERLLKDPTAVTKRKIVNGLNTARKPGDKPYDFEYIFPRTESERLDDSRSSGM